MRGTAKYLWRSWPAFAIAGSIIWYLFLFQPNVSERSELTIEESSFVFRNFSYKTLLGNTLCNKPTLSVIVFEDSARNVRNVVDNATGYGSGDASVRLWISTGRIPAGLVEGPVTVKKRVVYPCIFGSVREILSAEHIFLQP